MKINLLGFLLSMGIVGCSIGPEFEEPDFNFPSEFQAKKQTDEVGNKENNDVLVTSWWSSFNDPVLNTLVTSVANENLGIKASLARLERADNLAEQAFFGLFPSPNLSANYIKNKTAAARFPGIANNGIEFEIYTVGGSINWEIDLFGRLRRAYEVADEKANSELFDSVSLVSSIQAQIATAYIQLRGAQRQKQIAEQNVNVQESSFNIINEKYKIGAISPFDYERANSQYQRTRSLVSDFDTIISINLNRIAALLGKFPSELSNDLIDGLKKPKEIPVYSTRIALIKPFELIQRRADLRSAESLAKSASAEIGVALGDLYPKVSFIGGISREARDVTDLSSPAAAAYNYGPGISWSILNLNAILSRVDEKKANAKASLLEYKDKVVYALEEVENEFISLANLHTKVSLLKSASDSSLKAQQIAQMKYDVGSIGYLDLLVAQGDALTTQREYAQAVTELSLTHVSLYRALGGAWDEKSE